MPRPPKDTSQVTFRIPNDWIEFFEEVAEKLSKPGLEVSRTDVMRRAMALGIDELRKELKLKK